MVLCQIFLGIGYIPGAGGEGAERLNALVDRGLDQTPHTGRILQYLISRYPQQSVPLFGQITVTTFIVLATFVSVMLLPIHLQNELQGHTTKVGRVGWNRILATKLLVSTSSIANDLPHGMCKLVSSNTLVARKRGRIWVARSLACSARSPPHHAPLFTPADFPPPPPPPTSSLLGGEGDSRFSSPRTDRQKIRAEWGCVHYCG